jgi:hypothetical protein
MAKKIPNPDPAYQVKLAPYERLAATILEVERKGAANPYTAVNGHMFSYLHPGGSVALRLQTVVREAFLDQFKTTLFHAHGIVQKEYVTVPDDLPADTDRLKSHFRAGYNYVCAMKPKPSAKTGK